MPFPYPTRMDGKRITPARSAVAAREGLRILPSKREGLLQTEDHMARGALGVLISCDGNSLKLQITSGGIYRVLEVVLKMALDPCLMSAVTSFRQVTISPIAP
jgi:hypothetical protein